MFDTWVRNNGGLGLFIEIQIKRENGCSFVFRKSRKEIRHYYWSEYSAGFKEEGSITKVNGFSFSHGGGRKMGFLRRRWILEMLGPKATFWFLAYRNRDNNERIKLNINWKGKE